MRQYPSAHASVNTGQGPGKHPTGRGAPGPRTSYCRVRFGPVDRAITSAGVAAGVIGTLDAVTAWGSANAPVVVPPATVAVAIVVTAGAVFTGVLVAAVRALGRA